MIGLERRRRGFGGPSRAPLPLVSIDRWAQDRLHGFLGPLGDESALVAVLDLDLPLEPTILAELHAAGAGNLIELPGALPRERHAGLGGLAAHVARSTNILSRSAFPVNEMSAVPQMSMSSLPHWEVSMIRHQPWYSRGISPLDLT